MPFSPIKNIFPVDSDIEILGGSSDHTILDVTDSNTNYKIGDVVSFKLNYVSVLHLMASKYIEKEII